MFKSMQSAVFAGMLLAAPLLLAQGTPGTAVTGAVSADITTLFSLAEQKYPTLFNKGSGLMSYEGITYRFFAGAGVYAGVKDGSVYLIGGPFGNDLSPKMPLSAAISQLQNAPTPPAAAGPANPGETTSLSTLQGIPIDLTRFIATAAAYQPILKVEAKPSLNSIYVMSTSLTASTPVFGRSIQKLDYEGKLDTTYGTAGVATLNTTNLEQTYSGFAVDSTGRAYLVAQEFSTGPAITRFTASGVVDTSFGTSGKLTVGNFIRDSRLQLVQTRVAMILPDDSLLIASRAQGVLPNTTQPGDSYWVLFNIKADGTVNQAFGVAGVAKVVSGIHSVSTSDEPALLTLGGNGDIYMAGKRNDYTTTAYRFSSTGKQDTSYGTGGRATLGTGFNTTFYDLAVDASGALFGIGTQSPGTVKQGLVTKLTNSGVADTAYGTNGSTVVNFYEIFTGSDRYNDVLTNGWFDQSGKLLVGGMAYQTAAADYLTLARLSTNGTVDATFEPRTDATRFSRITWSSYAMSMDWDFPGVRAPVFPNADGSQVIAIGKQNFTSIYSFVRWK